MRKYRNIKTVVDCITFDSAKEAARYNVLKWQANSGEITNLVLQPKFIFEKNGVKICTYMADFGYNRDGRPVIEDVKSPMTSKLPVYRLKKKLVKAFYGIDIVET